MEENNGMAGPDSVSIKVTKPYNFNLTLRVVRAFRPTPAENSSKMRLAARIHNTPALVEIEPMSEEDLLRAGVKPWVEIEHIHSLVEWVVFSELDLNPFYRLAAQDSKLSEITAELHGLKPVRPPSLFEMAVIAITEQQISLPAAYRIRSRIIQKFGQPVEDLWIFPDPLTLAKAAPEDLKSCGLSLQKTQYVQDLAGRIASGSLNLDSLKNLDDNSAREMLMSLRGFGRWSADYMLVRGLARPDALPVEDLGIRSVVGQYMGTGVRLSAVEVASILEPLRPYRGLAAFYLLAKHRLEFRASRPAAPSGPTNP